MLDVGMSIATRGRHGPFRFPRAAGLAGVALVMVASTPGEVSPGSRPGVTPQTPWACPASHPIKGYLSESGRRVYYVPEHPFYEEASPERAQNAPMS